jgi:hypothetical protein
MYSFGLKYVLYIVVFYVGIELHVGLVMSILCLPNLCIVYRNLRIKVY